MQNVCKPAIVTSFSVNGGGAGSSRRRVPATGTLWLHDSDTRPVVYIEAIGQNQNIATKKFIQKVCLQQNSKYLNLKILNFTKRKFYLASGIFLSLDRSDSLGLGIEKQLASLSQAGPSFW